MLKSACGPIGYCYNICSSKPYKQFPGPGQKPTTKMGKKIFENKFIYLNFGWFLPYNLYMDSKQGNEKMASATKLVFQGSKITPDDNGIIRLNVLYKVGDDTVLVSIPNNTWESIDVLFNKCEVNMQGEYSPIINKVIRAAIKLFPNWQI